MFLAQFSFTFKDLYVIDLNDGKKEMFHKSFKGNILFPSAQGNKVVYYDEPKKQYFVFKVHRKPVLSRTRPPIPLSSTLANFY